MNLKGRLVAIFRFNHLKIFPYIHHGFLDSPQLSEFFF